MRLIIGILLVNLISSTAHAEVLKSDENGFVIQHIETVEKDKSRVFEIMTAKLGQWWNPDHSFSGDASNMQLDAQCFCERWGSNLVRHLNTEIWIENSKVVMVGGLGPLKELGLNGTMIWYLSPGDNTGTKIYWKYHVYGYTETDMLTLATAVDGVLAEQLERLVDIINIEGTNK